MPAGGRSPRPWTTRTPRRPQPRPRPGESTSRPSTLYPALPCGGGSAVPQTPLRPGRKDTWEPGAGGAWAEEETSARQGRGETAGSQGRGRSRNDPRAASPREPRDPRTHPKEAGGRGGPGAESQPSRGSSRSGGLGDGGGGGGGPAQRRR